MKSKRKLAAKTSKGKGKAKKPSESDQVVKEAEVIETEAVEENTTTRSSRE